MSVRVRRWTGANGKLQESWVANYTGKDGKRHIKTFQNKRDAEIYHEYMSGDVRLKKGISTRDAVRVLIATVMRLDRTVNRLVKEVQVAIKRK